MHSIQWILRRIRDEFIPVRDEFDRSRGVRTRGRVSRHRLRVPFSTRKEGTSYQAVSETEFAETMACLPPEAKKYTFIDLGCGRGRALLLAQEYGFETVIGIEYAPSLAKDAEKNTKKRRNITVHTADAGETELPNPAVIFLHNPFGTSVMSRVMENICKHGVSGFIVYINPVHDNLLESHQLLASRDHWTVRAITHH